MGLAALLLALGEALVGCGRLHSALLPLRWWQLKVLLLCCLDMDAGWVQGMHVLVDVAFEQLRCRRERLGSVALRGRWECGHRGASPRRLARRISFSMLGLYVSWKTGAGSAGALSALHGGSDPSRRCPSRTLLGNCVDHEADQPGGHDAQKQKGEAGGPDHAIAKYGQSGFCVYL